MIGNHWPKGPDLRELLDEFVVLIVGSCLGAVFQALLQPFPRSILIALAVLAVLVWLLTKLWGYLRETPFYEKRLWGISFAVGLMIGVMVVPRIGSAVAELVFPTPTVTPTPTSQPPCPSPPGTWPALAPITTGNVSDLRELSRVNVSGVLAVTVSGDGQWLAVVTRQGVCLYDRKTMQGNFRLFQTPVSAATFSLDGRLLAVGNVDGTVGVWDMRSEGIQVLWTLPAHEARVTSMAFSPNSQWLASASDKHEIRLWEARRPQQQSVLGEHAAPVEGLVFSLDGRLASCSRDGEVRIWEVQSQTVLKSITGHRAPVITLAFSPRGEQLASGSEDKTIRLWDMNGVEVRRLGGHLGWVLSVAFSPDGRLLASGSEDHTIRLWEVDTGALLRTLDEHTAGVYGVAFSPDGNLLISGSGDGTVRLWGVQAK